MLDENEKIKSTDEEKITPEVSEENQSEVNSDSIENKISNSTTKNTSSDGKSDEIDGSKVVSEKENKEEAIANEKEKEVEEETKVKEEKGKDDSEKNAEDEKHKQTEEVEGTTKEIKSEEETFIAKNEDESTKEQNEEVDYEKFDLEQLTAALGKLLKNEPVSKIKTSVDKIKKSFNQQFGTLLNEKKEAFLAEGGNVIDFYFSSPIKSAYNDLLFEYKTKRESHYKQIEQEQKENLAKRLALIEDLKHLIENAETSTMYSQFRELQDQWRAIGRIPSASYRDTWRTFEHHVERFYDLLHLSNDLRDLDFKHNLLEKIKLAERAEKLTHDLDLNKAFKELQVLHRLWKEEVGPVAREFREEIWERFSKATKEIHEKRHGHQKELESKYEDNIILKREVIEKIANIIDESASQSHKYWQQKIKELEKLRQEFFKIGKVPRQVNDKIWNEFKDATGVFNRAKNVYYKNVKKEQHDNLQKKNALVEKAQALKDSEEFKSTTEVMKQIQAEWKTIGHVPRKYSDKIWKSFKDACNHYFDRLHGEQDEANKEQVEVFNKKKEFLEKVKSEAKNESLNVEVINSYIEDWNKLGSLPRNMHHVEIKFNKAINSLYGKLDLDEKEIAMLKFKNMVNGYLETNNIRKLDHEQLFIRKKVDELTREIQQLENNISFISGAKDDNPLLKGVRDNIEKNNKYLEIWKTKLKYLSGLEY